MNVSSYTNAKSEKGKQLLFLVSVLGSIALIGNFYYNRKKSKLEMEKLNMEIEQMQERNKIQHPKG